MSARVAARRWIGAPLARAEDRRFLLGEAQYVGDLTLPATAHAAFVRSLYAHGRLVRIETDAALALRGVRAVLTGADLSALVDPFPMVVRDGAAVVPVMHPVLARDRVRYVGEPVALVVADTAEQAADAAEWVVVEVEELPAVVDPRDAEAAPPLHDEAPGNVLLRWRRVHGDVEDAFEARRGRRLRADSRAETHRGAARAARRARVARRGDRRAHALAVRAGSAPPARRADDGAAPSEGEAADRRPGRRRCLRQQGRPAGGDRGGRARRGPARPPGEVGGDAHRELARRVSGTRRRHRCRARGRR